MKHLWEYEHEGSGASENRHANSYQDAEYHLTLDSWEEFADEFDTLLYGNEAPELNVLYRWDWMIWPDNWVEPGDPKEQLLLFWILPNKGLLLSRSITVTAADEEAIRAWLIPRAELARKSWEPLLGESEAR